MVRADAREDLSLHLSDHSRDVDDVLTVTDEQLVGCMSFAASRMKLVIEPTGCLGFAAARQMKSQLRPEGT